MPEAATTFFTQKTPATARDGSLTAALYGRSYLQPLNNALQVPMPGSYRQPTGLTYHATASPTAKSALQTGNLILPSSSQTYASTY